VNWNCLVNLYLNVGVSWWPRGGGGSARWLCLGWLVSTVGLVPTLKGAEPVPSLTPAPARPKVVAGLIPPVPPPARPPVQLFRELLAATPERRAVLLAGKSEAARALILRRVREFEALPPSGRAEAEAQLRLAEFRFYLSPLLRAAPADRESLLAQSSEEYRPLLQERVRAWEALPPEARQQLLESEASLHYFVRQQAADPARLAQVLAAVPAALRPEVEQQFARWQQLSEAERRERSQAFQGFFDLGADRRDRTLGRMEMPDRKAMEKTLERFSQLPAGERDRCVQGFEKLANLSPADRADFLRNAARWEAMSAEDRAAWRRLVLPLPAPPPLPPNSGAGRVVTNR
jgi:hypothetical protein